MSRVLKLLSYRGGACALYYDFEEKGFLMVFLADADYN